MLFFGLLKNHFQIIMLYVECGL